MKHIIYISVCFLFIHSIWNNVSIIVQRNICQSSALFLFSFLFRSGELRWTVLSSDISDSDENHNNLIFCDFRPATWYQLKVSATNDAGKTTATYNVATTKINGGVYFYFQKIIWYTIHNIMTVNSIFMLQIQRFCSRKNIQRKKQHHNHFQNYVNKHCLRYCIKAVN